MKLPALIVFIVIAQATGGEPIRVVLPTGVDAAACQVHSFLIGSLGGAGDFARPQPGDRTLQIPTVNEHGIAGQSLKAYVWCPGYEVWTLALDTLRITGNRTLTPVLTPRPAVRFSGVVRAWVVPPEPLTVHVNYWPQWTCAFFGLMDCLIAPWPVADVTPDPDGSFAVDLPEFASDKVIASFSGPGSMGGDSRFEFTLRDSGWNVKFRLRPSGAAPEQTGITPRWNYPGEVPFDLEPAR